MNVIKQVVKDGRFGEQTIKMVVKDNERGAQGEKGDTGDAATITAGQAYSVPSTNNPSVINTGTSSNAVFDFYIPKGEKGEDGAEGPAGRNGKDGKDGAIQYTAGANVQISAQNVISATDTTYTHFVGATASTDGTQGLVPAPVAGDQTKFLSADGTWQTVSGARVFTTNEWNALWA